MLCNVFECKCVKSGWLLKKIYLEWFKLMVFFSRIPKLYLSEPQELILLKVIHQSSSTNFTYLGNEMGGRFPCAEQVMSQ